MENFNSKNGTKVRVYQGDAISLLAFDVDKKRAKNLAGFTIEYGFKQNGTLIRKYIYNRLTFDKDFMLQNKIPVSDKNSTLYSPIQKFNWVHVPNTDVSTRKADFGDYIYSVTPRYIEDGKLLPLDAALTVEVKIPVKPYIEKNCAVGFTRGFVSSVAYAKRFSRTNNSVRPKVDDQLIFDIKQIADHTKRWNSTLNKSEVVPYTFEEQHEWLGWQARARILEFIDEAINDKNLELKVLAFDLNEPEVCKKLLKLAKEKRLKIILDNSESHTKPKSWETAFEKEFLKVAAFNQIFRGRYGALAHCKVMVQLKNKVPQKVLTGSTNFSTNGIYVNSNHILIFNDKKTAKIYSDIFDASFGEENMKSFKTSLFAEKDHQVAKTSKTPQMTITFAPHKKETAEKIFRRISEKIEHQDTSDVLFAIMNDRSAGSILSSIRKQIDNENVFSYGITDTIGKNDEDFEIHLYKPNSKKGIRVAARGIKNNLPEPFGTVPGIDGYAIHHKFIVINFKGRNPVVYCGSSNLAFGPEQKNGDNLLEIFDKDIVTAFAIEALRLVDHFHWRNTEIEKSEHLYLDSFNKSKSWFESWFKEGDLKCRQRKLYIKE
ncbi:hypothetical protein J4771_02420 [Candidatus Kaistella beijingensis]|uniref:phospholipase D-like domain-containing protein n=1 Tax=Candidatus Kaistella beijingensis TaxID=2820270 RepID=UPI001CC7AC5C|nr:phospholipase D-like domain-containing protein [Candidatus Kaistella beijingensis]UBB90231.1 hypothetical protein J4771_02420 [Candidatus Kaistella beijingensis]